MKRLLGAIIVIVLLTSTVAIADVLVLPDMLEKLETEAFYGDKSISCVILPQSIKRIESKAFANSSLSNINLPDSLSFIAKDAIDIGVTVTANPGTYAYEWAILNGFLEAPKESDQLEYPQIVMDDSFESGTAASFFVIQNPNAEDYYFNLFYEDSQVYWDFHIWDPISYTFEGYDLQPGVYKLVITSVSDNYKQNTATKHFTVVGDKHPAPIVTANKIEVEENEEYTFSVNTAGAEKVLAREYSYGGYSSNIVDVDSEIMTFTYSNATRKKSYQFCLLINDHWSDFSDLITIIPKSDSVEPSDQLDLPQIIMDDTFESGIDVSFSAVQDLKAEDYYFHLYYEGSQLYWNFHIWNPLSYTFYGYDLQPGHYTLVLTATADNYDSVSSTKSFTIVGDKHIAPLVRVDKTNVSENDEYTFFVETSGAEKILAREYFQGGYSSDIVDVDSETMTFTYANATRKKSYQFCLLIDGHWSDFSEKITISPEQ